MDFNSYYNQISYVSQSSSNFIHQTGSKTIKHTKRWQKYLIKQIAF